MKWFKLMTDFDDDEKIVSMTDREGPIAQARLLKIYRMVAKQMDETDRHEVKYPATKWSKALWFRSAIDCRSFLDRLAIDRLLIADLTSNDWIVRVPNLLKIRARQKPIGSKTRRLDTEVDTDIRIRKPPTPLQGDDGFVDFWNLYPRKVGKPMAAKAWARLKPNPELKEKIAFAIKAHMNSEQWKKDDGRFIPHPATWLNQERYNDQAIVEKTWREKFIEMNR